MDVTDLLPIQTSNKDEVQSDEDNAAAWVDSDDERIVVSLASNPRLRKLRISEAEDLINGREYTKRLRRQFERLYPVPEWAHPSAARKQGQKKRRRTSNSSETSDASASEDEMSLETKNLSTQPLAKLLQNTASLMRPIATQSTSRKKLRPEVIDVHRTKDVGTSQAVSPFPWIQESLLTRHPSSQP